MGGEARMLHIMRITRSFDRCIVVASLATAVVSLALHWTPNGGRGLGSPFTPTAHAMPEAAALEARVAAFLQELGPADALVMNETKPEGKATDPVRLRIEGQRLTWDDRLTAKAWSIGAVHVDRAMKAILNGSQFAERRKELEEIAMKTEQEFQARGEALRKKFEHVTPQSPEAPQAQAESQALFQEYEQWRQRSMQASEKLFAEQVEAAYRELVSAVESVCDKEKIDIVVRFSPTAEPFRAENLAGAREQVIARTFLKYPETIDITAEVMKTLNISEG
jgi:Skp family chaperone for outer membrane proteins